MYHRGVVSAEVTDEALVDGEWWCEPREYAFATRLVSRFQVLRRLRGDTRGLLFTRRETSTRVTDMVRQAGYVCTYTVCRTSSIGARLVVLDGHPVRCIDDTERRWSCCKGSIT
jgi:hypothetical protein